MLENTSNSEEKNSSNTSNLFTYSITSTSNTKILFFKTNPTRTEDNKNNPQINLNEEVSKIMNKYKKSKILILTETKILNKYSEYIYSYLLACSSNYDIYPIEEGDFFKNQEIVDKILNFMLSQGYDRSSCIIGFGGGKITDLAGYISSIFLRGVDNILIPTNLLSMVDASIGGKTGINDLKFGKNLVGTIYQPKVILTNLWILNDLDAELISEGLAEIIKIFALFDKEMFYSLSKHSIESLRNNLDYFHSLCKQASKYKIEIIRKDETDKGIRNVLNFGHTIGHAVESVEALNVSHGKSVAIGLVIELEIAVSLGLTTESTYRDMKEILDNFNLPTEIPKYIDPSLLIDKMRSDKKTSENKMKIVVINQIGELSKEYTVGLGFEFVKNMLSRTVFIERLNKIHSDPSTPKVIQLKGSKSICNRALILSSLGSGSIFLKNFLFSEDTNIMIKCLRNLGVEIEILSGDVVKVIGKEGNFENIDTTLYVENAGTAARFLTSLCGICRNSKIIIDGNARMRERPIGDLLDSLSGLTGVKIEFLTENEGMPFRIVTENIISPTSHSLNVKSKKSSQYVTSLLLSAPFFASDILEINLTDISPNEKPVSYQYIEMTVKMMKIWGVNIDSTTNNKFTINKSKYINPKEYVIEPDASTANYYLTFTALHGGTVTIKDIGTASIQGDSQFHQYLKKIDLEEKIFISKQDEESTSLTSKGCKHITDISVNFDEDISLITDSFLALGVICASVPGVYNFRGLANQAIKECNRLELFALNLNKLGIFCSVHEDGIVVNSLYTRRNNINYIEISTANDHRMAMSFAILGSYLENTKISIDNKHCVNKTYPEFWKDFEAVYNFKASSDLFDINKSIFKLYQENYKNNPVFLVGMRACGKSTFGKYAAEKLDLKFIDFDLFLLEKNSHLGYKNISEIVEDKGWDFFRNLERELFYEIFSGGRNGLEYVGCIIACGGGIVENKEILQCLKSYNLVIFIDTHLDNIKTVINSKNNINDENSISNNCNRPSLSSDLDTVYKKRLPRYNYISNFKFRTPLLPDDLISPKSENFNKTVNKLCEMFTGFVYTTCNPMKFPLPDNPSYFLSIVFKQDNLDIIFNNLELISENKDNIKDFSNLYQAIEFRADHLVQHYIDLKMKKEEIVVNLAEIISKLRFLYSEDYIPIIFTLRSFKEGGFYISSQYDFNLYNYINSEIVKFGIEFFDIEFNYENINFINDFYKNSKSRSNYRMILSKHYINEAEANISSIKKDIYTMSLLNHDIIKIITSIPNNQDYEEMKAFINKHIEKPLIHFQLGNEHKMSRVVNTYLNPVYDERITGKGTPTGKGQMTLNEIENIRSILGMKEKFENRLYYVMGNPVNISPSPFIYESGYKYYNIDSGYQFERKNINSKEELTDYILNESNKLAFASITIPYKEEILSLDQDMIKSSIIIPSEEAKYLNSVNLVKKLSTLNNPLKVFCCNTDWIANYEIIIEILQKINKNLSEIKILLLGAGGASVAILMSLFMINFDKKNIHILNRNKSRAEKLAKDFGVEIYSSSTIDQNNHTTPNLIFDIVISSIPKNSDEDFLKTLLTNNNLSPSTFCVDLSYILDKNSQTNFRKITCTITNNYCDGIDFLLRQGYYNFEIFSGKIANRRFIRENVMNSI